MGLTILKRFAILQSVSIFSANVYFLNLQLDIWIFPNWLHHQVYPFFGPGERLSIAMNWNVHDSDEQLLLGKSEEQKKEFYEFQERRKKEKQILDKAKEDGFWEK